MKRTETQVAAPVVEWLQSLDWDVYQEVQVPGYQRADIVAARGPLLWVVEAKTSLSLQLLDQACGWLKVANYVSIATPFCSYRVEHNRFVGRYLRDLGIGRFRVRGSGGKYDPIRAEEVDNAAFRRRVESSELRSSLNEAQKRQAAGSPGGGYWTPFRQTCDNLREFLKANGPCSLRVAIDSIKHHYKRQSTAQGSMRAWIKAGKVKGVVLVDGMVRIGDRAESAQMELT